MSTQLETVKSEAVGFIESIKNKLVSWYVSMQLDTYKIIKVLACFGIGFFFGYILKKFYKQIFLIIISAVILALLLNYIQYIQINWGLIKTQLGINPTDSIEAVFNGLVNTLKANILYVIGWVLGFIIGNRVG